VLFIVVSMHASKNYSIADIFQARMPLLKLHQSTEGTVSVIVRNILACF